MTHDIPGAGAPDRRGRTGLDLTGLDLRRNPRVRVTGVELLSSDWYVLRASTYEYTHDDGSVTVARRETYDRGDGATILLYEPERRAVLLTRQFRYAAYVNEHPDGMLLETAAGLLDDDSPEDAIRREAAEETGVAVGDVERVLEAYMSPGSVTERLHFFAAPYHRRDVPGSTAGLHEEGEHIEVVELDFDHALSAIGTDIQDAKTILLLQWAALHGPFSERASRGSDPSEGQ